MPLLFRPVQMVSGALQHTFHPYEEFEDRDLLLIGRSHRDCVRVDEMFVSRLVSRLPFFVNPESEILLDRGIVGFDGSLKQRPRREPACWDTQLQPGDWVEFRDGTTATAEKQIASTTRIDKRALLTISDVSEIVGCSYGEARKRMLDGRIQTVKDGRWIRTKQAWVDEYLDRQIVTAPELQPEESLGRCRKPKNSNIEPKGIGLKFLKNRKS